MQARRCHRPGGDPDRFVGLLVLGGLLLVRLARQQERPAPPSPGQLLAERYARGDIEEEYRRRLATPADTDALSR
ncbi:hypothetical protein [Geodermatophilus sp. SYSU D00696]